MSIETKLLFFMGFLVAIFLITALYELYSLTNISHIIQESTEREIPLTQLVQESLVTLLRAEIALRSIFQIEQLSGEGREQGGELRRIETEFYRSTALFGTYIAAMTFGSESEEFKKSDGGLNYGQWEETDISKKISIFPLPAEYRTFIEEVDAHFNSFLQDGSRAIIFHRQSLRYFGRGEFDLQDEASAFSVIHSAEALRFSSLITESFSRIVAISNSLLAERIESSRRAQQTALRDLSFILFGGFFTAFSAGIFLVRRQIIQPLRYLTNISRRISEGDFQVRAHVTGGEEIALLASSFNLMTERLSRYPVQLEAEVKKRTRELEKANEKLSDTLRENYESAKLLVRKDRELTITNEGLTSLAEQLESVGKILVHRDLDLSTANTRLQELDAVKSEFVSIAAHQLRTPLTGIKWAFRALLDETTGVLNEEHIKVAKDGLRVVLDAIKLVGNLLNVARIEEGRFGFEMRALPIRPVFENLTSQFMVLALGKGIVFKSIIPKDLPFLNFDTEKLSMAFENLFENAYKYTAPGGSIIFEVVRQEEYLRIRIVDTGIGIPSAQFHRVFAKFFRADNALLFQTSGSGLGLYMVKNIIEKHGGTITLKSVENQGTTVTVTLPLIKVNGIENK